MCSIHEIPGIFVFVELALVVFDEVIPNGSSGLHQIIVGNLGKEQVVCHMSIGDVVVQPVDSKAECPVDGLKGSCDELPVLIAVDQGFRVVVLKVCDSHKPPAINDGWCTVPVHHLGDLVVEKVKNQPCIRHHNRGRNHALDAFLGMLLPHTLALKWNKMATIGHSVEIESPAHNGEYGADQGITFHEPGQSLLGLLELFVSIPRMRIVLVNMIVILVVLAVGEL